MKEINRVVHDERTYIESVGKQDRETVREALADQGADTILRVCLGVDGNEMPIRALGYYASAIAVQEHYFPEAELQFVYPILAASVTNGVDILMGKIRAEELDDAAREVFPRRYRKDSPDTANVKSFTDQQLPSAELERAVAEVLDTETDASNRLKASAKTRGANCAQYVAAHVLMHDTNPALSPIIDGEVAGKAARVISIGAQSERSFYLARMACQRAQLLPEQDQVATGQLFTRHVIPPYLSCREGEPTLSMEPLAVHPVPSVERDLEFLYTALTAENARYAAMTIPAEAYEYDFFGPGFAGKTIIREFI